ncbi:MAG: winged helix-turn-helix domain-containing protein, partial [Candidatus Micrarchaeaceae archaeon]
MTKNLQTKNKILELLKKRKMTVTEISEDLGISKSTASQHVSELTKMRLIEQEYNPHFKKVKYYKALGLSGNAINNGYNRMGKVVAGASIVALLGAILIAIALIGFGAHYHNIANATTNTTSALGGALACPMLLVYNNPNTSTIYSIVNDVASGYPCQMTYIDTNASSFTQALGGLKYISDNGTVYIP